MKSSRRSTRAATESLWPLAIGIGLLGCLLLARPAAAEAGVALALNLPDANPVHRDFAAGIVGDAYARWAMLSPQLSPEEVERCQAEERCLLQMARRLDASYLLLVGVAALGATDFVVSVKLLDTGTGRELAAYSDLARPGKDPRLAGAEVAQKTFAHVEGLPAHREDTPVKHTPTPVAPGAPYDGLSPVALAGWSIAGAGALLTASALAVGGAGTYDPRLVGGRGNLEGVVNVGGPVSVGVLVAGLGVVAVDAFLPRGEP